MSRLTSRLERLERERLAAAPAGTFTGRALEQRAAVAAEIVGGSSGAELVAMIAAAQEVARQGDGQGLAALTDRDLLLTCLVAWGWAISPEDDARLNAALDAETRARLNARLAILGAGEAMQALDQATLDDLAGRHGPERQGRVAQRLGYVCWPHTATVARGAVWSAWNGHARRNRRSAGAACAMPSTTR